MQPDFRSKDRHGKTNFPALGDYVNVPRLSTYGTFKVVEMLSMETMASLYRLQKGLHNG